MANFGVILVQCAESQIIKMRKLSKEELLSYRKSHFLTVKRLKEFLEEHKDISDDAIVVVERVEDAYYEGIDVSGFTGQLEDGSFGVLPEGSKATEWGVYLKPGEAHWHAMKQNEKIDSGEYLNKDQYPDIKPEHLIKTTEEELEKLKTQYHPVFCCVKRTDDLDILFLDLHY